MKQFSFIERWGVVSMLIVGAIYCYLNYFRDDFIKEHDNLVKKNNSLVKTIEETVPSQNTASVENSTKKLQKELNDLTKEFNELKALRLTDKGHEEEMVMRINEMAANNALMVANMGPYQAGKTPLFSVVQTEQKLLNRILYQIKFSGSFPAVYSFLEELQELPTVVNVTGVNLQRIKDSENVNVDLLFIL